MRPIAILLVLITALVVAGLVFRPRQAPEAISLLGASEVPGPRPGGDDRLDETAARLRKLFPPKDPKKRAEALAKGRAEAEAELDANHPRIWTYGKNLVLLDWETGLYINCFGGGGDEEFRARIEGHNARIAESIRDHGLPKNSLKPWEKELRALKDYSEDRSRTESPIRLDVDGPEVRSPDGRFSIKLARRFREVPLLAPPKQEAPVTLNPGVEKKTQRVEGTYLIVNGQDTEADWIAIGQETPELIWGPEGSWFAVLKVKYPNDDSVEYEAIDLRENHRIYP